ncbi:MAG TPA: L,D-transpeptidase [Jatrophihabitantaceae bacterium]|jgi:lipoprotein-anchoring transpeptidase ErfK/SrfK
MTRGVDGPWSDTGRGTTDWDSVRQPAQFDEWGAPTTYGSGGPGRPRGGGPTRHGSGGGRGRGPLLVIAAVAAVAVIAGVAAVRLTGRHHDHPTAASPGGSKAVSGAPGGAQSSHPAVPTKPVHVSLFQGDGQTYGIGMPLIAQFSKKVTDAHAFNKAVTVKVNGQPVQGAWFWVASNAGYAMEAHYRPQQYWPARSKIEMDMPLKGISAGKGLAFDDSLTLQINIGAAHVSTVDGTNERMTVTSDGTQVKQFPVSLGKASTPTYLGKKIVMAKKNPQLMVSAPGESNPYSLKVPWSVRLTNSGEFVHAAAWNSGNIGSRSTSHGCTNLTVADAQWFYNFSQIGDVVTYTNTGTSNTMPSWDGFGDWNVSWADWQDGNLLKN